MLKGGPDFEVNQVIGLSKELPPLRMAQDDVVTQALQHQGGNFSSECPRLFKVHVLRTHLDR
jgi:hypothetical protein